MRSNAASRPVHQKKPVWFKAKFPTGERFTLVRNLVREHNLSTVCEEAHCPNIGECFNSGTATFMILGDTCTRACRYCAVNSGRPDSVDPLEPVRLSKAVKKLGLDYVVLTSVDRDDLSDGGASVFAACIRSIRHLNPSCMVEILIPDFQGNLSALHEVLNAKPAVLNHNIETVERLYPQLRPKGNYSLALNLFRRSKRYNKTIPIKSGLMVGIGETIPEIFETIKDLRDSGVELLTIGQYLQPTPKHVPISRFVAPQEFENFKKFGYDIGFRHVESGPLVRSSYHAASQAQAASMLNR